jgi:hypothetical protein|tara:strand:+ start:932 stop:1159 length:228 start_codon:yes stop_codon:yes gene_type:complete
VRDSEIVDYYIFLKGVKVKYNNNVYIVGETWKVKNTGEIYIALEKNGTWLNMRASRVIKIIYEDITKTKCKRCSL